MAVVWVVLTWRCAERCPPRAVSHALRVPRLQPMSAAPSFTNQRVRLRGLSREVLNGAVGVAGALDAATGRFPVRLEGPRAALDAFPDNIKARPGAASRIRGSRAGDGALADMHARLVARR